MPEGIIIFGAGGHAKVIADIILLRGEKLTGFLDDNVTGTVFGYPVLGRLCDADKYKDESLFIVGIGDNLTRKKISEQYNVRWYTAIHPGAVIARDAEIGDGTVVSAQAVVNPSSRIGRHCIVNTAAVVEHDCVIGDYSHISPNATLCGNVKTGELTHIGAGATVISNKSVYRGCIIGAGAVVVKDTETSGTYTGVPAKKHINT